MSLVSRVANQLLVLFVHIVSVAHVKERSVHLLYRVVSAWRPVVAGLVVSGSLVAVASCTTDREAEHVIEQHVDTPTNRIPAVLVEDRVQDLPPGDGLDIRSGGYVGALLTIDTSGQSASFSTFVGSNADGQNFWIGGGGANSHGEVGNTNEGSQNVCLGNFAGRDITTGFDNVIVGGAAGRGVTTGGDLVAVGRSALQGDGVNPVTGHHNTAIGVNAMGAAVTTAEDCVALGLDALEAITTGFQNTCVGYEACAMIDAGFSNAVLGSHAFEHSTTAHDNIAVGVNALRDCTECDHMTVVGNSTGSGITIGESDTIVGGGVYGLPAALTSFIILSDGDGKIRETHDGHGVLSFGTAIGPTLQTAHLLQFSPRAAASVDHGSLSATATDYAGTITSIGASAVTLTFTGPGGAGFATATVCTATPIGSTPQLVTVTNSATSPTFSCFAATTAAPTNCVDLNYTCVGVQ